MQLRSDSPETAGIAGNDCVSCPSRTHNDVGVDDVRRRGSCQEEADCGRVRSVERHQVRAGLSNEAGEARLPGGIPNGLCQSRRWNCNPHAKL